MNLLRALVVPVVLIASLASPMAARSTPARGAIPYDLFVTMAGSPEPVGTGEVLTLSISVVNTGAGMADPVLIQSSIPEGTVYESSSSTNGLVMHPEVGATGPIQCTARSLESGDRVVVKLNVRVIADGGSTVTASASATGPNDGDLEADPDDNSTRTAVPVSIYGTIVDLHLAIDPEGFSAGSGAPFGFDIVVTNRSTDTAASGVIVRTETPANSTLAELDATGTLLGPDPRHRGAILCQFESIAPGASVTLHATFNVNGLPGGRVELTASVASSADDPEPDDNAATASVGIVAATTFILDWDSPDPSINTGLPPMRHLTATEGVPARVVDGTGLVSGRSASPRGSLNACNIYRSTRPGVRPSAATFVVTLPATATTWTLPVAPGGTFFVVTGHYEDGESEPSNEASANVPAAVLTTVKVTSSKIVGNGSGFSSIVTVFIDGIPFVEASKLKKGGSRVVQKGALLYGESIASYLARHPTVLVSFRNANGGVAAYLHSQ